MRSATGFAAGDLDPFVDSLDRRPAVLGAAGCAVFGEFFEHGDVGGLHRRGRAPGDAVVVSPDDAGHAGDAGAGGVELGAVEMREMGVRRGDRAEVRVAGEDRRVAGGVAAGDGPIVARATGDAERRAQGGCCFECAIRFAELSVGRDDGARVSGQGWIDLGQRGGAELGGDARPCDLLLPGGAEQEREQLGPGDGIFRPPRADLGSEQARLERARGALDRRVDAGQVGGDLAALGLGCALPCLFGGAADAEREGEAVGGQAALADDGGDAAGRGEAVPVHLPEAIAGLDETESEQRVGGGAGEDMGDGPAVAQDFDRRIDAIDDDPAAGACGAARQQRLRGQRRSRAGGPPRRAQHLGHVARFIPRGYGVAGP